MIKKFMEGFNVTIMAYGQTGAGKTYALEGNSKEPGIIKESISLIFETAPDDCKITCSYIQLYN